MTICVDLVHSFAANGLVSPHNLPTLLEHIHDLAFGITLKNLQSTASRRDLLARLNAGLINYTNQRRKSQMGVAGAHAKAAKLKKKLKGMKKKLHQSKEFQFIGVDQFLCLFIENWQTEQEEGTAQLLQLFDKYDSDDNGNLDLAE